MKPASRKQLAMIAEQLPKLSGSKTRAPKGKSPKQFDIELWLKENGVKVAYSAPSSEGMSEALKVMEMKAVFSRNEIKLQRRIAQYNDDIYYDLGDKDWKAIKVTKVGCSVESTPPILFTRNKNMMEQVPPDFSS